jgi:Kef-type K+ transport system membrane component KefB
MHYPAIILLVGGLIVAGIFVKAGLKKIGLPDLVGFLFLGLVLRLIDTRLAFLSSGGFEMLHLLGKIGLIMLLFRIGMESDLGGLMRQLRPAGFVWLVNVILSGITGFAVPFYLLGFGWIPSLLTGAAFTATSVGISVAVWEDCGAISTPSGELLLDVAELDDISAVVIMALIFSLLPRLSAGGDTPVILTVVAEKMLVFAVKLIFFGLLCFLFARYVEKHITNVFRNLDPQAELIILVVGIGIVIASFSEILGFSMAIGAFFAGLVFSRDPETVKRDSSFIPIYELLTPFFFISVGLNIAPGTFMNSLVIGTVLAFFATAVKIVSVGLPVWALKDRFSAALIGISMVPRAEIAMVILQAGHGQASAKMPAPLFNGMILVCAITCILTPMVIRGLLKRWPP